MRMRPSTADELEADWLSGKDMMMTDGLLEPYPAPDAVWEAVLRLVARELTDKQTALLAAGPVEGLLVHHGAAFINRVVAEAMRNPAFVHVLGGVWRRDIPEAIWRRVEAARGGCTW